MLTKLLSTLTAFLLIVAVLLGGLVNSQALSLSREDSSRIRYSNTGYTNNRFQYFSTNTNYTPYQELCMRYGQYMCNQQNSGNSDYYNSGNNTNYNYGNTTTYCREPNNQKGGAVSTVDGRNFKLEIVANSNNLPYQKVWVYAQPKVGGNPVYAAMTESGIASSLNSDNCVYESKSFTFNMSADKFAAGEYTVHFCSATCTTSTKLGSVMVNIPRYTNQNNSPKQNNSNSTYSKTSKYNGTRYLNYVCGNMNNIYILSTPNGKCANSQQRDSEMVRLMTSYQSKYNLPSLGGQDMINKLVSDRILVKSGNYWAINFTQLYAVVEYSDYVVQTY